MLAPEHDVQGQPNCRIDVAKFAESVATDPLQEAAGKYAQASAEVAELDLKLFAANEALQKAEQTLRDLSLKQ